MNVSDFRFAPIKGQPMLLFVSIVFDKGALNWEYIWSVRTSAGEPIAVSPAEFDPVEDPELSSETTITRLL